MKNMFLIATLLSSMAGQALADQLSVDAPQLDQKDTAVNQQIFELEKNNVLSSTEAAVLQARRGNIMREANIRRKKNNGILPTADLRELSKRMDNMSKQVSRRVAARSTTPTQ
ncbi:hypothetical protein KF913_06520 [Candidatus Obscuribacterales bacterium]|nr:hypothetical protein [Candidatus Obscuribacterales bacterium]